MTSTSTSPLPLPMPSITVVRAHTANWSVTRGGIAPEALVLHIADGTLAGMDAWFSNPAAGVSAHFGVGRAGEVHQYVHVADTAHANGSVEPGYTARLIDENAGINPNRWSVSIEHEGRSGELLTPAQWEASTQLAAWLFDAWLLRSGASGVALDRDHILMHRDITPRTRARCPGWPEEYQAAYIARVRDLLDPTSALNRVRVLLNAITVQAQALEEAAHRAELESARFRLQAKRLRELIEQYRTAM